MLGDCGAPGEPVARSVNGLMQSGISSQHLSMSSWSTFFNAAFVSHSEHVYCVNNTNQKFLLIKLNNASYLIHFHCVLAFFFSIVISSYSCKCVITLADIKLFNSLTFWAN